MSAVLQQLPLLHTQSPYMLKEKAVEPFATAFTAVNGRASPPSPPGATSTNGVNVRQSPSQHVDQRPFEHDYRAASHPSPPESSSGTSSPESTHKRRRSDSSDEDHSPDRNMEVAQHRLLPQIDHPGDHERRWTTEPHQHSGYRDIHERRPMDPAHGSLPPMSAPHLSVSDRDFDSAAETARAAVQADVKKRKRQFANRTKTGCGTCRRRKKKCDEAKPECNNCTRGAFECEGYASKLPWPKNGVTKPPPPLQAKEQMPLDPTSAYARCSVCNQNHVPHCDPNRSNTQTYPDPRGSNGPEGLRTRPIVVDEQERKPPASSHWGNGWQEPPRVSYPEHTPPVPAQYSQPPPAPNHDRAPSRDHLIVRAPGPPQPRQHHPRVYHHTPQSMSQTMSHPPAVAADNHHQAPQPPRQPPMSHPTSAPPAPPQPHYAPQQKAPRTEKEKMLLGEPFLPFDEQLSDERMQCTGAVWHFNSIANPSIMIARGDRERHFKRIVAAGWIPPRNMGPRQGGHVGAHMGGNVNVSTPFHCDYGYNISLGDNVVIGSQCQFLDSARIAIGRNTKIGARVLITTLKTPSDTKLLKGSNGTEIAEAVFIGENVYIGDGVVIEAGVKIGNNAIVRPGSVVVSDIAPDVVARGNPAFG